MKTALFLAMTIFCIACQTQYKKVSSGKDYPLCNNGEYLYAQAGDKGWILHLRCPKYDGGNMFLLVDKIGSMSGTLLDNPSRFIEAGTSKLVLESAGPKFFLVKVVGKDGKYKYSFIEEKWIYLKPIETGQSTSERD